MRAGRGIVQSVTLYFSFLAAVGGLWIIVRGDLAELLANPDWVSLSAIWIAVVAFGGASDKPRMLALAAKGSLQATLALAIFAEFYWSLVDQDEAIPLAGCGGLLAVALSLAQLLCLPFHIRGRDRPVGLAVVTFLATVCIWRSAAIRIDEPEAWQAFSLLAALAALLFQATILALSTAGARAQGLIALALLVSANAILWIQSWLEKGLPILVT